MDDETREWIRKKYYDPEFGFVSAKRLWGKLKGERPDLTLRQVQSVVSKQALAQRFEKKRARGVGQYPIYSEHDGAWASDLTFMKDKRINNGFHVLFTLQHITSRFLIVEKMKDKEQSEVLRAAKAAFAKARASGHPVEYLESDLGSEYISGAFGELLAKQKPPVKHRTFQEGDHNALGIINNAHRQLKRLTQMYMKAYKTKKWVDALPSLVRSYNRASNRMMRGWTPEETHKSKEKLEQIREDRRAKTRGLIQKQQFQTGDRVRVLIRRGLFQNREVERWSKTVHTIVSHNFRAFKLDTDDGRYYKSYELKKVSGATEQNPSARKITSHDVETHLANARSKPKKVVDLPDKPPERRKQPAKKYASKKKRKKPKLTALEGARKLIGRSYAANGERFVIVGAKAPEKGKRGVVVDLKNESTGKKETALLTDVREMLKAGETWEISGVVGHKYVKNKAGKRIPVYKTLWKGYDESEATYEPGSSFVGEGAKKWLFAYQKKMKKQKE